MHMKSYPTILKCGVIHTFPCIDEGSFLQTTPTFVYFQLQSALLSFLSFYSSFLTPPIPTPLPKCVILFPLSSISPSFLLYLVPHQRIDSVCNCALPSLCLVPFTHSFTSTYHSLYIQKYCIIHSVPPLVC